MALRKIVASFLIGILITSNITVALATDSTTVPSATQPNSVSVNNAEVEPMDDLNVQLNDLYKRVGEELNINYLYVKIIHMIAGGKAVYAEELPNIYVDQTVESLKGAFSIEGAKQSCDLEAPWIVCADESVARPSMYYLPDAAYNATAEVIAIMNSRYNADRGIMQVYFDALDSSVKTNIIFCEAILEYTGSSVKSVNSFYNTYEKILYDKQNNENVMESDGNGNFTFKPKYESIIRDNGIVTDRELEILGVVLRFDSKLAASCNTVDLSTNYVFPYDIGYTSRENMMIAAMSIVGKVRYVWGGGHLGSSTIEGISPAWKLFYDTYGKLPDTPGYDNCIRPNRGWCPIHESVSGGNGCLLKAPTIHTLDEYIDERAGIMDVTSLRTDSFTNLMKSVNIERGINSHRLDGLDCSGYASWLYSQIADDYVYDSGALNFIHQEGMTSLGMGERLLPGDVFSWGEHIVVIVGPNSKNSDSYVIVESGPNTVKFGVAYYAGARASDIADSLKIAKEANQLLGNLGNEENTRMFNMTNAKFSNSEESDPNYGYQDCGRLTKAFIDQNTILSDSGKRIIDMTAQEIIQHTINSLTYQYISGISGYTGTLFDVSAIDVNMKNIEASAVKQNDIVLNTDLS